MVMTGDKWFKLKDGEQAFPSLAVMTDESGPLEALGDGGVRRAAPARVLVPARAPKGTNETRTLQSYAHNAVGPKMVVSR
jgi:hypothetical protein